MKKATVKQKGAKFLLEKSQAVLMGLSNRVDLKLEKERWCIGKYHKDNVFNFT